MLHLKSETKDRWLAQVDAHFDLILIDHAHCEKKAAGTALNLLFAYVDVIELCREGFLHPTDEHHVGFWVLLPDVLHGLHHFEVSLFLANPTDQTNQSAATGNLEFI